MGFPIGFPTLQGLFLVGFGHGHSRRRHGVCLRLLAGAVPRHRRGDVAKSRRSGAAAVAKPLVDD